MRTDLHGNVVTPTEENVQEALRLLLLAKKYATAAVASRREELRQTDSHEHDDPLLTAAVMLEALVETTRAQATEASRRAIRVRMRRN
jgi:hypothetical protein